VLKRSPFKKPPLERKAREAGEFTSFTPRPRQAVMAAALHLVEPVAITPKTPARKSQAIRDSARGEECTVRIPGCPGDPARTIWSHAPLGAAGKGRAIKALDVCGAYACTHCDAVVDGQAKAPAGMTREQVLLDWFMGHMRSLVILKQKGLV
jgi:hypothetical protein